VTWRGRLRYRAVEGGTWVLETSRGEVVLVGAVPKGLDGATVEVEGEEIESFGIAMAGPQVQVRRVKGVG
jgi:hypothetical protein